MRIMTFEVDFVCQLNTGYKTGESSGFKWAVRLAAWNASQYCTKLNPNFKTQALYPCYKVDVKLYLGGNNRPLYMSWYMSIEIILTQEFIGLHLKTRSWRH